MYSTSESSAASRLAMEELADAALSLAGRRVEDGATEDVGDVGDAEDPVALMLPPAVVATYVYCTLWLPRGSASTRYAAAFMRAATMGSDVDASICGHGDSGGVSRGRKRGRGNVGRDTGREEP